MKIVMYVIWNYLGYDLEKPSDKDKFNEFTKFMGISKDNAKTYLRNSKRNVGGIQSVLNYIPDKYKTSRVIYMKWRQFNFVNVYY